MFEEWFESKHYPGSKVKLRPLTARRRYTLEAHGYKDGDVAYDTFTWAVLDWVNAPLDEGGTAEKFDPTLIDDLATRFVMEVVLHAYTRQSVLSEDERKN